MRFQHSSERDKLQTTALVRFQVADHDTNTLQSRNMHNTGKYDLVWAPIFQFVQAFQIWYRDYGKRLRYNTITYHNAYTDTHDNTFQNIRLNSSGF